MKKNSRSILVYTAIIFAILTSHNIAYAPKDVQASKFSKQDMVAEKAMIIRQSSQKAQEKVSAQTNPTIERLANAARAANSSLSDGQALVIAETVYKESTRHGIDPWLVMGIILYESKFHIKELGSAGEIGLMQILPSTGKTIARELGYKSFNVNSLWVPETNIRFGVHFLAESFAWMRRYADGQYSLTELALLSYNRGPDRVIRDIKRGTEPSNGYASAVMKSVSAIKRMAQDS